MGRRDPKLGDRKPRDPVREKRVKNGEWIINIMLVRDGTELHVSVPLTIADSQLQNLGSLVEQRCSEIGARYVTKPSKRRRK